jgi:sarcosine oxidase subunit beta
MSGLLRRKVVLQQQEPKSRYDVVIIGGGGHGLALAYYLAKHHGVRDVAVLERSYIGSGATGRNTTVLRANYKTPETVAFFKASFELYTQLSAELDFHLLLSPRGLLWLAHSEASLRLQRERAYLNNAFGVDTEYVDPEQIGALCPVLDLTGGGNAPILGAAYHPPGSIIRHDAVVWGYASAAQRLGVHIHQGVEVTDVKVEYGRCVGVSTSDGAISAGTVVSAAGGYVSLIARMAGVRLPITTHPLQAFVTEAYKPVLNRIVASSDLLVYISQSARGELLVGGEIEDYCGYSTKSTFDFLAEASSRAIDLLPFMAKLRILRQWAGVCDMTPDFSPLLGRTQVEDFFVDGGWGTWGFKAIPIAGVSMAELIATGRTPPLIAPFGLERFRDDRAVPERASAGTH